MCWEVVGERERSALLVDVSTEGARVERPYIGGRSNPWRIGNRPVSNEARDGVHDGSE